jgi:Ni,Fe-hydrogenase I large subunit
MGTPIADEAKPLEVLRTIHSFDPCMACGVHLLDINGNELNQVTFQSSDNMSAPLIRLSPDK